MRKPKKRRCSGLIVEVGANFKCCVRLDSGEQVSARIPHHYAGMSSVIALGDRVAIEQRGGGFYVVLGDEQTVIDQRCLAHFTSEGRTIADWFVEDGVICFRDRHGDIGEMLSSNDRWYAQLIDYLRRIGAERQSRNEDAHQVEPDISAGIMTPNDAIQPTRDLKQFGSSASSALDSRRARSLRAGG